MDIIQSFRELVENGRASHNYPKPRPPSELVEDERLSEHLKKCAMCRIDYDGTNGRITPSKDERNYFCGHSF